MYFLLSLRDSEPNLCGFMAKNFRQLYPNCVLKLQTRILKKKRFFDKNTKFYHLRILVEKIADYGWKGCDSVVKTSLYVSRERFGEIGCFEQFLASFYNYRSQSQKMLEFWQLISDRFTGTKFYVSNRFVIILRRMVLFRRMFFCKLFVDQVWKVLELLRILSWQCCYICNRFEESLVKTIFFRKGVRFCHNFWTMSKYNWPVCVNPFLCTYGKKVWSSWESFDGSAEVNSNRSRDRYEVKIFSDQWNVFEKFFFIWRILLQGC